MDFPIGRKPSIPLSIRDQLTGAPITTGVTVSSWSLFGPTDAVTPVATGTGATSRGNGVWTIDPNTSLNAAGTYRLAYSISAPANAVVDTEELIFTVGPIVRGAWTIRELLASVIRSLGGSVRASSLIATVNITDPYWKNATATFPVETFRGSEIVLIDPPTAATYADWPVYRVDSFDQTTGMFTLNNSTGIAAPGDSSGLKYALTNVGGMGFMFEHILEELKVAYDEVQPAIPVSYSVGYDIVNNQLEYTLPEGLVGVDGVAVRLPGTVDLWDDIGGSWEVLRDRGLLILSEGLGLSSGDTLRITGKARAELPRLGGSYTDMPGVWLRERMRFGLLSSSPNQAHQRTAQVVYANLLRMPNPHPAPLPGARRIG